MSELFALSASRAVNVSFSLTELEEKNTLDDSGWGVGFYRIGELAKPYAAIIKEPISARYSIFTYFLKYGYMHTNIFVSNIRLASVGAKVHLNTHPFELMLDPRTSTYKEKSWIFTHNGTMPGIKTDQAFHTIIKPHGNTDSEYVFCYLIERLREVYIRNGYILSAYERIRLIEEYANAISRAYPENLNFIMSDGERVYAYYGGYDISGGLWYCTQTRSSDKLAMLDKHDGMTVQVSGNDESNTVSFIAARPLTGEGWEKFKLNELKVFKDGKEIK